MSKPMTAAQMKAAQAEGKTFYTRGVRIGPITQEGATYRASFEVSRQLRKFEMTGPAEMLICYTDVAA
jgi:hypothetical protein